MDPNPAPAPASPAPGPAGFWRRALALLVDALITLPASYLILDTLARAFQSTFPDDYDRQDTLALLLIGGLLLILWLYTALYESSDAAATPGKILLNTRVTGPTGSPPGFWRASLRFAAKILSAAILGFGFLMAAGPQKRALHDRIASTRVIHRS